MFQRFDKHRCTSISKLQENWARQQQTLEGLRRGRKADDVILVSANAAAWLVLKLHAIPQTLFELQRLICINIVRASMKLIGKV